MDARKTPLDFLGNCQRCGAQPPFLNCPEGCGDAERILQLERDRAELMDMVRKLKGHIYFGDADTLEEAKRDAIDASALLERLEKGC